MASYALAVSILPSIVQSVAFGGISGTYARLGTLTRPARMVLLQNFTNAALMISIDGVNDFWPIQANSSQIFDFSSNQALDQGAYIAQGTTYYVKDIGSPSSGSIYLTYFYGASGGI
jgi:hypothetical protein